MQCDKRNYPDELPHRCRRYHSADLSAEQLYSHSQTKAFLPFGRQYIPRNDSMQYCRLSVYGYRQEYHAYEDILRHKLLNKRTCNAAVHIHHKCNKEEDTHYRAMSRKLQCSSFCAEHIQRLYFQI